MAQSSIGTSPEASNIYRLLRAKTKSETKEFQDEFTKHLKRILDSLEGTQKIFWLIDSDMADHTITVKLGSSLGLGDLPPEILAQVQEYERKKRLEEDGPEPEKHELVQVTKVDDKHFQFLKKQKEASKK
jgi:transcriptional regulator of heat shock response